MALVREHGKLRPQPPRAKNLPGLTAGNPRRGRTADGRFAPGNSVATDRSIKAQLRRQLGREAQGPEVEALYRETLVQFRAELRQMPSQAPQVQRELAARARWSVLSARYATRAAELGLDSPKGQKAMAMAMQLDQRAERLLVTATDIAERLAKSAPRENPIDRLRAEMAATRRARELAAAPTTNESSAAKPAQAGTEEPSR